MGSWGRDDFWALIELLMVNFIVKHRIAIENTFLLYLKYNQKINSITNAIKTSNLSVIIDFTVTLSSLLNLNYRKSILLQPEESLLKNNKYSHLKQ